MKTFFLMMFSVLFLSSGILFAQPSEIPSHVESYRLESGSFDGGTIIGEEAVNVYTGTVELNAVPWIQLFFGDANLGTNSYLIITSLHDGYWQKLDAVSIEQWKYFSAFFNGGVVEIALYAAPFDQDIFFLVEEVVVGDWVNGFPPESQCGPTDDRISSNQPATSRLMNIGCTAWIIPNGHFVSAGHCLDGSGGAYVEFQVPPSLPGGSVQHPGPEDQYSVDFSTKVFTNGGIGNDWGTFEVFPNSITGLMPKDAQGAFWPLVQDLGPDSIRITGYGVDTGVDNQTQQTHVGPNAVSSGTTMRYVTDTEGGNSGSPVIDALTGNAVGVHTHGGCNPSGGNNNGTSLFHTAFWDAVEQGAYCPVETASNPNPAHLTTDVSINTELTWTNGADAISNELYFGTDPGNLPLVQSGTLATSWNVGGPLDYLTVYYWKVVEIGDTCSTIGPLWSFTTMADPNIICVFTDEFATNISQWTMLGPSGFTNWTWQSTSGAGGDAGEMRFSFFPSFTGESYVISDIIPSAGLSLTVEFAHYLNWAAVPFTIGFGYTTNGGTTWTELWSAVNPPGNIGPETLIFPSILGDANFQLGAWFSGLSSNLNSWLIDNVYACYVVPVEMTSFTATSQAGKVTLRWSTATEINNLGFEIERKIITDREGEWIRIGFKEGHGTTTEPKEFSFVDDISGIAANSLSYRLKQIDFDGTYEYSDQVLVGNPAPLNFTLHQNYPNPFNPSTKIKFAIPVKTQLQLNVYNMLGEKVAEVFSGTLEGGFHEFNFDAANLSSGVYVYRIESDKFTDSKKMSILK